VWEQFQRGLNSLKGKIGEKKRECPETSTENNKHRNRPCGTPRENQIENLGFRVEKKY
jgi:hypothetical protein